MMVTDEMIERQVRNAAAAFPDRTYQSAGGACQYSPDDRNPSGCIVGLAMRRLGVDLDGESFEAVGAVTAVSCRLSRDLDVRFQDWLGTVQAAQDAGDMWANAVAHADEMYPL